jgi:ectoine hydroxylase
VTTPENGAMEIVPGSHKLATKPEGCDTGEGVMPVCVKAGSAVLFDRRMWHRRGINTSDITRRVLFFGYSYRWLRGLDYNNLPEEVLSKCDPIRRQLLGDGVDVKGWWQPTEADVPLKGWLRDHRGEEYVK